MIAGATLFGIRDGSAILRAMANRHYSARRYRDGRTVRKTTGPGRYLALRSVDGRVAFAFHEFIDGSGEQGVNLSLFRKEGPGLASDLIREACALAWQKWPGERLYTYVDPAKVHRRNIRHRRNRPAGWCFLKAGWRFVRVTKTGKHVFEILPGGEPLTLTQPSEQAMKAARKLLDREPGWRSDQHDEESWEREIATAIEAYAAARMADLQHPCQFRDAVVHIAAERDAAVARMTAYAAERVAETHANTRGAVTALAKERDAAIARAEAAEAEIARWKAQFESTNAAGIGAFMKLQASEERVRVLEICHGEYHKDSTGEQYDHKTWCPRIKTVDGLLEGAK